MSLEKYKLLEKKISGRISDKKKLGKNILMIAAVSILIEKDNPEFPLYMIKRANEGKHALEWAFPGGKTEPIDRNLEDTASIAEVSIN